MAVTTKKAAPAPSAPLSAAEPTPLAALVAEAEPLAARLAQAEAALAALDAAPAPEGGEAVPLEPPSRRARRPCRSAPT